MRKVNASANFSFKVTTNNYAKDEMDLKISLSLGKVEFFDEYKRPLPNEFNDEEIPIIKNLSKKLPMKPACYGFSSFGIDYSPAGYISLNFFP